MYLLVQHYFNVQFGLMAYYSINKIINGYMSVFSVVLCVYE